ncbi:hypothetical protein K461DRAFT_313970 [Myriangium duriaei CBS 260.36]|uniref:Uncharacterized protein n=1 Tax=Myriangium duriaei CBS 260.36 TaxID=1168546 RepID=A0A9P4MFF8_9PEZI|nr:hypothetical protein K461DRAFT_313970 [Myriangium duriaei CBS 260.36]
MSAKVLRKVQQLRLARIRPKTDGSILDTMEFRWSSSKYTRIVADENGLPVPQFSDDRTTEHGEKGDEESSAGNASEKEGKAVPTLANDSQAPDATTHSKEIPGGYKTEDDNPGDDSDKNGGSEDGRVGDTDSPNVSDDTDAAKSS